MVSHRIVPPTAYSAGPAGPGLPKANRFKRRHGNVWLRRTATQNLASNIGDYGACRRILGSWLEPLMVAGTAADRRIKDYYSPFGQGCGYQKNIFLLQRGARTKSGSLRGSIDEKRTRPRCREAEAIWLPRSANFPQRCEGPRHRACRKSLHAPNPPRGTSVATRARPSGLRRFRHRRPAPTLRPWPGKDCAGHRQETPIRTGPDAR